MRTNYKKNDIIPISAVTIMKKKFIDLFTKFEGSMVMKKKLWMKKVLSRLGKLFLICGKLFIYFLRSKVYIYHRNYSERWLEYWICLLFCIPYIFSSTHEYYINSTYSNHRVKKKPYVLKIIVYFHLNNLSWIFYNLHVWNSTLI